MGFAAASSPAPSVPWHAVQCCSKTRLPASRLAARLGVLKAGGSLALRALAPVAASRSLKERMYDAIAIISGLFLGSGRPFKLRCIHSLMRSSMVVVVLLRPENLG